MSKQLIDYVRKIESKSEEILKSEFYSDERSDSTGSTISTNTTEYHFKDGVVIEYEHERDDGGGYPGCRTSFYTYSVKNSSDFKFEGETSKIFDNSFDISRWVGQA